MKKTYEIYIVCTMYAGEEEYPNVRSVHASFDGAKKWIADDKKRIKREGNTPYASDYILRSYKLEQ